MSPCPRWRAVRCARYSGKRHAPPGRHLQLGPDYQLRRYHHRSRPSHSSEPDGVWSYVVVRLCGQQRPIAVLGGPVRGLLPDGVGERSTVCDVRWPQVASSKRSNDARDVRQCAARPYAGPDAWPVRQRE